MTPQVTRTRTRFLRGTPKSSGKRSPRKTASVSCGKVLFDKPNSIPSDGQTVRPLIFTACFGARGGICTSNSSDSVRLFLELPRLTSGRRGIDGDCRQDRAGRDETGSTGFETHTPAVPVHPVIPTGAFPRQADSVSLSQTVDPRFPHG